MAKTNHWMLIFTMEVDIEPEVVEGFGDVSVQVVGHKLAMQIGDSMKNDTVTLRMSIPKNEHWSDKRRVDVPIQWDSDIKRTLGISEIKSISFFNPDARKAINPDEHSCPECRGVMSYNRDDGGRKVRMCGDCGYSELYDYPCGHEDEVC